MRTGECGKCRYTIDEILPVRPHVQHKSPAAPSFALHTATKKQVYVQSCGTMRDGAYISEYTHSLASNLPKWRALILGA